MEVANADSEWQICDTGGFDSSVYLRAPSASEERRVHDQATNVRGLLEVREAGSRHFFISASITSIPTGVD
jgi:hypothetical protein